MGDHLKKKDISELIYEIDHLEPNEKNLVLKSLNKSDAITEKDIQIMEWSLEVIKEAQKNNNLLKSGLEVLNKALDRQNRTT